MSLKLFRSTGYSSLLSPGETRAAMHPGWIVFGASAWAGLVCDVALWRSLAAGTGTGIALLQGIFAAALCGLVLSALGWRTTLKPAVTLLLVVAALSACAHWDQAVMAEAAARADVSLRWPAWASFLRWHVTALLVVLAAPPIVWAWNAPSRRLPGPQQLRANLAGMAVAAAVLAASGLVLYGGYW
jgi:glucan phosphoethanolaminetransferase (alkaline phosphatase superfamily)